MPGGIFKKQRFKCIGCGKSALAKVTVKPEQAPDPIAPPPGWFRIDLVAQHPETGGIGSLVSFTCTEACAEEVATGGGVGKVYIDRFKAAFAPMLTASEPPMGPDGPNEQGAGP